MSRLLRKLKCARGVSFIEVMIALAITGVVTTAVLRLYVTQHQHYLIQDDITDIQQNARASIDELSRHIRLAGFDLPLGLAAIEAYDTNPDTIVILYHASGCDSYLSAPMPLPSSELKCGSDVSCFYDGQFVFIYDPDSAAGEWFTISHVQTGSLHLQHNTDPLSRIYDANSLVFAMTRVKFYIDNTTDPEHPRFMVQQAGKSPQIFAENITDLQFTYTMKNGVVLNVPDIAQNTRSVQIELSGRSNTPDLDDDGNEEFRTRSFQTSVFLRNIGI